MQARDIDLSLRAAEPAPDSLADVFSPPADAQPAPPQDHALAEAQKPLGPQSPF